MSIMACHITPLILLHKATLHHTKRHFTTLHHTWAEVRTSSYVCIPIDSLLTLVPVCGSLTWAEARIRKFMLLFTEPSFTSGSAAAICASQRSICFRKLPSVRGTSLQLRVSYLKALPRAARHCPTALLPQLH